MTEQRALAHTGLAAQHRHPAHASKHVSDEPVERLTLATTTEQPRGDATFSSTRRRPTGTCRSPVVLLPHRSPPGSNRPANPTARPAIAEAPDARESTRLSHWCDAAGRSAMVLLRATRRRRYPWATAPNHAGLGC